MTFCSFAHIVGFLALRVSVLEAAVVHAAHAHAAHPGQAVPAERAVLSNRVSLAHGMME